MGGVRPVGRHNAVIRQCPETPWQQWTYEDIGAKKDCKSAIVVRYGAFGDMIMASSIFPHLKEEGYHITVSTVPRGADIIRSDPHVDEILIQKDKQIPNAELRDFWDWLGAGYDRYIQLSESIEANLLAIGPSAGIDENGQPYETEGQDMFYWSKEKRHELLNRNYIEETHRIAGVPFDKPLTKFYPTIAEKKQARLRIDNFKRRRGLKKLVMVVLSGSSVHKSYPWMDHVIANVLYWTKDIGFITAGDTICQMLEYGWSMERRVMRRCGIGTIRDTLTMAQMCDMVVGPETGVLNAVGMEKDVEKILFLSHSSVENACRDWVNTKAVVAEVPCYPCHQMHNSMDTCNRDEESHGAACQAGISPKMVAAYIMGMEYTERSKVRGGAHGG